MLIDEYKFYLLNIQFVNQNKFYIYQIFLFQILSSTIYCFGKLFKSSSYIEIIYITTIITNWYINFLIRTHKHVGLDHSYNLTSINIHQNDFTTFIQIISFHIKSFTINIINFSRNLTTCFKHFRFFRDSHTYITIKWSI